jgi:hypothetical protein
MNTRIRQKGYRLAALLGIIVVTLTAMLPQVALAQQERIGDITVTSINCDSGLVQGTVEVVALTQGFGLSYLGIDTANNFFDTGGVDLSLPEAELPYTGTVPFEFTVQNLASSSPDRIVISVSLNDFSDNKEISVPVDCNGGDDTADLVRQLIAILILILQTLLNR